MNNGILSLFFTMFCISVLHIWCSSIFSYLFSVCNNHLVWKRIKGKWVLITHATSEVGVALCEYLAERRYKLIITGPSEQLLNSLKTRLSQKTEVDYYVTNYSTPNCNSFVNNYDIGLMINKIGFLDSEPSLFVDENVDFVLTQLYKGPLLLAKAVLKNMIKKQCGYIVNIGFTNCEKPRPGYALMTSIKASFKAWSECLYYELSSYKINVEYMDTGLISTDGKSRNIFKPSPAVFAKSVFTTLGNSYYTIPYLYHNFSNLFVFFFPSFVIARLRRNRVNEFSKEVSKLF